ncbi:3-methylcrotonyl-CoA carboxylase subunit alpha [Agaricicola taiwanensis]|uniref:3-methylcrotonyl-CoA carboxylase subunit alpha n=1 Tax=Agaricicola taiwanensis TaxID=591372 RepID=A0A8J3DXZ8_9RHOB|nr:biotin carboxylase N-terminal domain-containing protein [Agaricicola taiwanensis]GGE46518.1 3-methylcrotonyl-CoA carboxylase subunit alpha [Agaricicola taiwanensis]
MFDSILIANRGEIACRIIRTARRLGLRTIAVYSEVDADALHVREADEAHLIGPAPVRDSYLNQDKILTVLRETGAACVHPGYGFLSENADFAEAVAAAGAVFVGPPPSAIRAMGLKDEAKAIVSKAGVPVVPGFHGAKQEPNFLREKAYEIGYPVLIKAVAGGGGKGMRRVDKATEFLDALDSAKREALNAFGDERVLVERYIQNPRHIEVQIFADSHGNTVHLFERDCSLQRRHQKVIEEAPAPGMTQEVRAVMGAAAVAAAEAVSYTGAGTVEFIVDGSRGLRPDGFFFMEMNTRLQVEHPVTEAITGLDLVELQLRVAAGEPLPFSQNDLAIHGHAVEARVYAEDPETGFLPSTGTLHALKLPRAQGIRIDSGVSEGDTVSPFYDPMIAKVIAQGETREEALERLQAALQATLVAGPRTNVAFLSALASHADFRAEIFDTGFIDRNLDALGAFPQAPSATVVSAAARRLLQRERERLAKLDASRSDERFSPWSVPDCFRLGAMVSQPLSIIADGVQVEVDPAATAEGVVLIDTPDAVIALARGRQTTVRLPDPFDVEAEVSAEGDTAIRAPLNGRVLSVLVQSGETVERGQRLVLIEAMKMEHALAAPRAGIVASVKVQDGDQVTEGTQLLVITDH